MAAAVAVVAVSIILSATPPVAAAAVEHTFVVRALRCAASS
jgi:hypothetical protein